MSEHTMLSKNWSQQRRDKPPIEYLISAIIIDSALKQTALDFVAYLRKYNYGIVWSIANDWWVTVSCRAKARIGLRDDSWAHDERLKTCS